jgi:hypothetical protein
MFKLKVLCSSHRAAYIKEPGVYVYLGGVAGSEDPDIVPDGVLASVDQYLLRTGRLRGPAGWPGLTATALTRLDLNKVNLPESKQEDKFSYLGLSSNLHVIIRPAKPGEYAQWVDEDFILMLMGYARAPRRRLSLALAIDSVRSLIEGQDVDEAPCFIEVESGTYSAYVSVNADRVRVFTHPDVIAALPHIVEDNQQNREAIARINPLPQPYKPCTCR